MTWFVRSKVYIPKHIYNYGKEKLESENIGIVLLYLIEKKTQTNKGLSLPIKFD